MQEWNELGRHLGLDFLLLVIVGMLPSMAMASSKRKKSFAAALMGNLGLGMITVTVFHINLFNTLVHLPDYDWVHKLTISVVFAAASLPVTWLASRKKVPAGWILVAGLLACALMGAQAVSIAKFKPAAGREITLRRCLNNIDKNIRLKDHGGVARAIDSIPVPVDTRQFDLVFAPILQNALLDKQPVITQAAARKLGERGDPASLPFLLDAVFDAPPEPRREMEAAINILASRPGAGKVLVNLVLNYKGPMSRKALAYLIEKHPAEVEKALPELLRSGDEDVRKVVTGLIRSGSGSVNVTRVLNGLVASLKSEDLEISGGAAASLAALADLPAVQEKLEPQPLIIILKGGKPEYRPAAARLLRAISASKSVPALLEAAKSQDETTAREAIAALVELRSKEAREIFGDAVSSADPGTRALGFQGLRYVLPRNMSTDSQLVKDARNAARIERDPAAKRAAAGLLAWLDLPGAFDYAESLYSSGASSIEDKLTAIAAFDLLGEESAVNSLMALAQDPEAEVRKAAIEVIGHVGDAGLLPKLRRIADDPDPGVRAAIETAIREVSARKTTPLPQPNPEPFSPGDEPPEPPEPPPW